MWNGETINIISFIQEVAGWRLISFSAVRVSQVGLEPPLISPVT
jgi:hypothetical protein